MPQGHKQDNREDAPASDRTQWAISRLPLPDRCRILEIGCGDGGALAALLRRPEVTTLHGLDPHPPAFRQAEARNSSAIADGRLRLSQCTIETFEAPPSSFDLAFAINVNLHWLDVPVALPRIARLLSAPGSLHLFYETRTVNRLGDIVGRIETRLAEGLFATQSVHHEQTAAMHRIHITAVPE